MQSKRSVTSAVVLQVLRWLKRAPESFLTDRHGMAAAEERLPEPGPGRILRFDTRAMHGALDARRQERGLTWRQVAAELPAFTASMLTALAEGPLIGFPRVMLYHPMARASRRGLRPGPLTLTGCALVSTPLGQQICSA